MKKYGIGSLFTYCLLSACAPKKALNEYSFQFREPFFSVNTAPSFRAQQHTHYLYDVWSLWGHNLPQFIHTTEAMMAQVQGARTSAQYDFSSPELEAALVAAIAEQVERNPTRNHFMILPNDNALVCQCAACVAQGNTETNASPAVFSLLNRLAKRFKNQYFFTTAYISTRTPPTFKLAKNAGVLISSMHFPKAVVLEESSQEAFIKELFKEWNQVSPRLYLWDYAINFNNYFDSYPSLFASQANLQFYKKLGVEGVFMQGNETGYTAFEELKTVAYAQLLKDVNIDLRQLISTYFTEKYPDIGEELANYYLSIEERGFRSRYRQDIYSSIHTAKRKYLDIPEFNAFYEHFEAYMEGQEVVSEELEKLWLAMTFQQLEVLGAHGLGVDGHPLKNSSPLAISEDARIPKYIQRIRNYSKKLGILIYNEQQDRIEDYMREWEEKIKPTT